jgi:hypothetical protein
MPTDGRVPPSLAVLPALDLHGPGAPHAALNAAHAPAWSRGASEQRAPLFCLVEPAFGDELVPALRAHLALHPVVSVLVERRNAWPERPPKQLPRRRAPVAERDVIQVVPSALRASARHLRLVQPMTALGPVHQDTELLDLVAKTVAMEPAATSEFWWRVRPRVLARLALRTGRADDAAIVRTMLGRVLDELPGYDRGSEPLPTWLDRVVDRFAEEHTAPPPVQRLSATAPLPHGPLRVAA